MVYLLARMVSLGQRGMDVLAGRSGLYDDVVA